MKTVFNKALAYILVLCLSFSFFTINIYAQKAENGITYQYYSDQSGNAGGQITILSENINGEVKLYWGKGGRKLENYSELATAILVAGKPTIIEIQKFTAIPEGALQIVTYYDDKPVYSLIHQIPNAKLPSFGEKRYSFGVISDVHLSIKPQSFTRALNFFKDYGCAFVSIAGDITQDGNINQLNSYKNITGAFSDELPVYAAAGNHDAQSGINKNIWKDYTGHDLCHAFDYDGDRFIFLGNNKWDFHNPSSEILTKEQLDWLENELEANKDKTVYLYQHVFLKDTCGNIYDANGNGVYDLWYTEGTADEVRFRGLMAKYPNVIWFSGHSHWKFYLQYLNKDLNIFDGNGEYCTMVHVPSVTTPRDYINGKRIDSSVYSEGYVVDVYDNVTVLRGYDFVDGKFYAFANYVVDTSIDTTPRVISVKASPQNITLTRGSTAQLTVKVIERYGADTSVIWEVSDTSGDIAIDQNGLLTISPNAKFGNYTVTVTSVADPDKKAEINLAVSRQDGSKEHPFLIRNSQDFIAFSNNMNNGMTFKNIYFKQIADIDLTNTGFNGTENTREFLGIYDGNGHIIKANISSVKNSVFGYIGNHEECGILMNLGVDTTIKNSDSASGIAYSVRRAGLVINCWSIADVSTTGPTSRSGGISSSCYGYLFNCYGAGNIVSPSNDRGGLAGYWYTDNSSKIKHAYYLSSSGKGGNSSTVSPSLTLVTADYLKSEDFVETLNSNLEDAEGFLEQLGITSISVDDLIRWEASETGPVVHALEGITTISSFKINGVEGVIDSNNNITVTLPYGTDVSKLTPEITLDGQYAVISPTSGTARDFTKPVVYTVTAENKLTQSYTVTVEIESPVLIGDVNQDGTVTVIDVVTLRRIITQAIIPTDKQFEAGDVNKDGTITVTDVIGIRRIIMGKDMD